jgi:TPR repeat protein
MKLSSALAAACLAAFASLNAHAGMAAGLDAFKKGQYADARREVSDLASQGDADAMALMGEMLMSGLGGSRDELKARQYILQAHEKGSLRATYTLGYLHLQGNLVAKDQAKGIELVKAAAEKSHPEAQSLLGAWIATGSRGMAKDEAIALTWFKPAAEREEPVAMYWMGWLHEEGKGGLPQDKLLALD